MNKSKIIWHLLIWLICLSSLSIPLIAKKPKISISLDKALNKASILEELQTISQSITVKILGQEFLGSGILISKQDSAYIVLTNDHVLRAGSPPYLVQTLDGEIYTAKEKLRESSLDDNDLAVLEFTSTKAYAVAKLGSYLAPEEEVFAGGFIFSEKISTRGESHNLLLAKEGQLSGFVFRKGKVFQVLDKALEGGYQVGYTNDLQKGMSGGPLLNSKGKVVAINGMHAYPLWGNPYVYKDSSYPETALWEQMSHYSWGIPIETFKRLDVLNIQK